MLTVACVLRRSPDYDEDYVHRLAVGVHDWLSVPYNFVCLSDKPVPGVETIELEHEWPGWWAKLELFKLEPPVIYFDLDTMITGSLDELAGVALLHPFVILRDFYREKGLQSAMMAWHSPQRRLYEDFRDWDEHWQQKLGKRGDQAFLEEKLKGAPAKWQDVLPGQVCSYKVHVKNKGVPQNCRVVCFHGRPKPRDVAWTI